MKSVRWLVLLALLFIIIPGCARADKPGMDGKIKASTAVVELADLYIARQAALCFVGDDVEIIDREFALAMALDSDEVKFIINHALDSGAMYFEADFYPECLEELRNAVSCEQLSLTDGFAGLPACQNAFPGAISIEGECLTIGCAPGLECVPGESSLCGSGACTTINEDSTEDSAREVTIAGEGEECDLDPQGQPESICADGLSSHFCYPGDLSGTVNDEQLFAGVIDSFTGICTARPTIGQDCNDTNPCNDIEAYCSADGTCASRVNNGQSCGDDLLCRPGSVCVSGVCSSECSAAAVSAPPANAACDRDNVTLEYEQQLAGCSSFSDSTMDRDRECRYLERCYRTCGCSKQTCDQNFTAYLANLCPAQTGWFWSWRWYKTFYCRITNSSLIQLFTNNNSYNSAQQVCLIDNDGDGDSSTTDCDDNDPARASTFAEIYYNDIDDDCDEATIDNDRDGDGYEIAEDCNDTDPAINPGRPEVFGDRIDNDCNAATPDLSDSYEYATVVGVMTSFSWGGEAPITPQFIFNVSAQGKQAITRFLQGSLSNTAVLIDFVVYSYDQSEDVYFKAAHSNLTELGGTIAVAADDQLILEIEPEHNGDVLSPQNFQTSLTVFPEGGQQQFYVASDSTQDTILQWDPTALTITGTTSFTCRIVQGFNLQPDDQNTVGFVRSLKIGDTRLTADLEVVVPKVQ